MEESPSEINTIFRPLKRRKVFRQRDSSQSPIRDATATPESDALGGPTATDPPAADPVTNLSVAELLRQRKALQQRHRGINFSAAQTGSPRDEAADAAPRPSDDARVDDYATRFAPQTGQVADVNKHMMDFIDAEIERRFRPPSPPTAREPAASPSTDDQQGSGAPPADPSVHRQPAALGRILEIDLGPDAAARNVAATERARAARDGVAETPVDEGKVGKKGRGRRRRRNSTDLRRDRIVEEVLRENRLEVYDEPTPAASGDARTDDDEAVEAADERVAEQFRRDFLDAAQQSRRRRPPAPTAPTRGGKDPAKEKTSKGPRLGGSRSARAAMREKELAEKGRSGAR